MYVITGATGNTGKRIAENLLARGKQVRVIARTADKLAELGKKGADVRVGSTDDSDFLTQAFKGATAAYLLSPPNLAAKDMLAGQKAVAKAQATALRASGVKYAVMLSSMGAHSGYGMGPVNGLYHHEQALNQIGGLNVLHLRPGYFLENFMWQIGMIKSMGSMGGAMRADAKVHVIATQDIAEVATARLLELDFEGKEIQELLGSRDMTPGEIAKVFGAAIGRPELGWYQVPYEQEKQGFLGFGASESVASSYAELSKSINEGRLDVAIRDARNTTKTTPEMFAEHAFAPAFKAAG